MAHISARAHGGRPGTAQRQGVHGVVRQKSGCGPLALGSADQHRQGRVDRPSTLRVTIAEWGQKWLEAKEPTLKVSTAVSYKSLWEVCILPAWGSVRLADVTHQGVAAWVGRLSTKVGPSRCRKAAVLFSGMLSAAVRDQRISRNPCDGVSLPRLPDHRQRFLTMAELHDLADRAGDTAR